jgi:hypothetical protein
MVCIEAIAIIMPLIKQNKKGNLHGGKEKCGLKN